MEPFNFCQDLKGPDQVNYIKGAFAQYDKNSAFGILTDTFTHANIPITNQVLHFVLTQTINKITDNIYLYFPRHCDNFGPQMKGIDFDQ